MKDRFTHKSKFGVRNISASNRAKVYERDNFTCQFCGVAPEADQLSIDHLDPVSRGGLDEITNYVTSCRSCNSRKSNKPLAEFAESINISIEALPVHGDPIIANEALPIQIRLVRKRIFDRARQGEVNVAGKSGQQKLEKAFRRELWQTEAGADLSTEFPDLPGQVRVMIPEIRAIAKSEREFVLLVELAKSAKTRNLIGTVLTADCDIESTLLAYKRRLKDDAVKVRIDQATARAIKQIKQGQT